MPVCNRKMEKEWVLCSYIILQHKTCHINLTDSKLSKNNYPNEFHTLKKSRNRAEGGGVSSVHGSGLGQAELNFKHGAHVAVFFKIKYVASHAISENPNLAAEGYIVSACLLVSIFGS
jgi:hypothetical protein